ncbi:hypothetical protein HBH53_014600 [Parastagonospora nodorum]|nr:hypothetical protein HBH53_014600 [Parastagonospora nodorum]
MHAICSQSAHAIVSIIVVQVAATWLTLTLPALPSDTQTSEAMRTASQTNATPLNSCRSKETLFVHITPIYSEPRRARISTKPSHNGIRVQKLAYSGLRLWDTTPLEQHITPTYAAPRRARNIAKITQNVIRIPKMDLIWRIVRYTRVSCIGSLSALGSQNTPTISNPRRALEILQTTLHILYAWVHDSPSPRREMGIPEIAAMIVRDPRIVLHPSLELQMRGFVMDLPTILSRPSRGLGRERLAESSARSPTPDLVLNPNARGSDYLSAIQVSKSRWICQWSRTVQVAAWIFRCVGLDGFANVPEPFRSRLGTWDQFLIIPAADRHSSTTKHRSSTYTNRRTEDRSRHACERRGHVFTYSLAVLLLREGLIAKSKTIFLSTIIPRMTLRLLAVGQLWTTRSVELTRKQVRSGSEHSPVRSRSAYEVYGCSSSCVWYRIVCYILTTVRLCGMLPYMLFKRSRNRDCGGNSKGSKSMDGTGNCVPERERTTSSRIIGSTLANHAWAHKQIAAHALSRLLVGNKLDTVRSDEVLLGCQKAHRV